MNPAPKPEITSSVTAADGSQQPVEICAGSAASGRLLPLTIIPARGGSKGIPHKNIVPLNGRPLIAYTIDVAREITPEGNIIFSTDDPEILDAALAEGLADNGYRRPTALATDTAGSREVILDAMNWADNHGINYNCVVLLQPTSPLRTAADVRAAMELYSDDIDMAVSVMEARSNPYYNCYECNSEGNLTLSKGDGTLIRRQDAPPAYEMNGAVYVINPESIRRFPLGKFPRRRPYLMPAERSIDIDSPIDLVIASALLSAQ